MIFRQIFKIYKKKIKISSFFNFFFIVTHKVANRVASKKHEIHNKPIKVSLYYKYIGSDPFCLPPFKDASSLKRKAPVLSNNETVKIIIFWNLTMLPKTKPIPHVTFSLLIYKISNYYLLLLIYNILLQIPFYNCMIAL